MSKTFFDYKNSAEKIKEKPMLNRFVVIADKAIMLITVIGFMCFSLMTCFWCLNYLKLKEWSNLITCFLWLFIPLSGLIIISLFRRIYNAPRPYEVYDFTPAIPREKRGKSFPSRHIFSIFIITYIYLIALPNLPFIWICMAVLGIILAVLRVTGGVHFIKDVVCGAAFAIMYGLIWTCLILAFTHINS